MLRTFLLDLLSPLAIGVKLHIARYIFTKAGGLTCRRVCSRYAITLDKCLTRYVSCNRFDSTMSKLFETGRINRRFHTLTASIRDSGSTYRLIVFWIPVEQPTCKFPSHEKLYEIDRFFSFSPSIAFSYPVIRFIDTDLLSNRKFHSFRRPPSEGRGEKISSSTTATIRLSRQ